MHAARHTSRGVYTMLWTLTSKAFFETFRRFRENLWHLSDDSTKIVPREGANAACVTLRNDRER